MESLIDDLREHLKALQPTDKAFPDMWKRRGTEMLAIDLKAAGIPYVDEMQASALPEFVRMGQKAHVENGFLVGVVLWDIGRLPCRRRERPRRAKPKPVPKS